MSKSTIPNRSAQQALRFPAQPAGENRLMKHVSERGFPEHVWLLTHDQPTATSAAACVPAYEESVRYTQRIGDAAADAIAHFNIGHAYMQLPDIHDLDAAEAAYQRCLDLEDPNDSLARALDFQQLRMVQHKRFRESQAASEPADTVLRHVQARTNVVLQMFVAC